MSENYEKAALGVAGLAIVAVGALIATSSGKVEEDFTLGGRSGGDAAGTPNKWKADWAIKSLGDKLSLKQGMKGNRPVDAFVSVPLVVQKDNIGETKDIVNDEDIHPPIPNSWWLENKIDLGFSDSPHRDADEDGFSNLEEFNAGTKPSNPQDHPPLINKLAAVEVEKKKWLLKMGSPLPDGRTQLTFLWGKGARNERDKTDYITSGATFPSKGPYVNQFSLQSVEQISEDNPSTGVATRSYIAKVKDERPHLKDLGREYIVRQKRSPNKEIARHYAGDDRAVVLVLRAVGQQDSPFSVAEGKTFSLPPGEGVKSYRVIQIKDDDTIIVQYKDAAGETKTKEIVPGQ